METIGFKKLSNKEKEESYGGWAWLATAVPIFLQAVMTTVSSYKMLSSNKGSVKYDGADAKWDDSHSSTKTSRSTKTTHHFYAF